MVWSSKFLFQDFKHTTIQQHVQCVIFRFVFMCSAINQRNRMRTIDDVIEASKREMEESKNAVADPFTRRQCRPTLVTKVSGSSV